MNLKSVLDSLYTLGSLWGGLAAPSVCTTSPLSQFHTVREAAEFPARMDGIAVTAFIGVNVVPMDAERVLLNQTVMVTDGRVTALGPAAKIRVPAGAVRIDGRGKYLMPGLADMHEHNIGLNATTDRLFQFLANGVTNVRFIDGEFTNKRRLAEAEIPGPQPRVYVPIRLSDLVTNEDRLPLDTVAARAAAYKAAGASFLNAQSPARGTFTDSVLAAVYRILPLGVHAHGLPFENLLALGAYGGSNEHLGSYFIALDSYFSGSKAAVDVPTSEIESLAVATQRAGVWISPTLDCIESKSVPNSKSLKFARQLVKALHDARAGLLLSADAEWGHRHSPSIVHRELAALVRAGLTPYQALLAGTRNVAQYFGLLDSMGTVAVDKQADLVLLYGNPLADIRHTREPAGVMIGGQWLDRAALDRRLMFPAIGSRSRPWPVWEVAQGTGVQLFKESAMLESRYAAFGSLTDSLTRARSAGLKGKHAAERLRQRLAEELGAIRALLPPDQHEMFDPAARVWMREQVRQGYRVLVAGVTPTP